MAGISGKLCGAIVGAFLFAGCTADGEAPVRSASASVVDVQQRRPMLLPPEALLATRLLMAHNQFRAQAGVPPLSWDPALAAGAAAYGPPLAARGALAHSPRGARIGIGENLWMGTAGAFTPEVMVGSWGAERSMYRDGVFPNVSTTGNWLDVSHYTAMIWRTTTKVGCALHRSGRWDYLICRYSPSGNRDGQRPR